MPLGQRIRDRRRELGWTQEELARRLGVRQNVISRLESGTVSNPSIAMIRNLARVLGVTADYLVGMYDDDPNGSPGPLEAALSP
jgi:transcriptional regulator with XRE-family HTH domain